jgi:hypothetical protein
LPVSLAGVWLGGEKEGEAEDKGDDVVVLDRFRNEVAAAAKQLLASLEMLSQQRSRSEAKEGIALPTPTPTHRAGGEEGEEGKLRTRRWSLRRAAVGLVAAARLSKALPPSLGTPYKRRSLRDTAWGVVAAGRLSNLSKDATTVPTTSAPESHTEDSMMWDPQFGDALRVRPNRGVKLVPVLDDRGYSDGLLEFRDITMPKDRLFACSPRLFRLCSWLSVIAAGVAVLLMVLLPIWGPFAILRFTNTSNLVGQLSEGSSPGASNHTPNGSTIMSDRRGVRWDPAWDTVCLAANDIAALCFIFFVLLCPYGILFESHPAVLKLVLKEEWLPVGAMVGTSWVYAATAATLQPTRSHVLYLLWCKVVLPLYFATVDAIAVTQHLRLSPAGLASFLGEGTGRRTKSKSSKKCLGVTALLAIYIFLDVVRHYLLVSFSEEVSLVTLNITNPWTGKQVSAITNRDTAASMYWTSLVFAMSCMFQGVSGKLYRESMWLQTFYTLRLVRIEDDGTAAATVAAPAKVRRLHTYMETGGVQPRL